MVPVPLEEPPEEPDFDEEPELEEPPEEPDFDEEPEDDPLAGEAEAAGRVVPELPPVAEESPGISVRPWENSDIGEAVGGACPLASAFRTVATLPRIGSKNPESGLPQLEGRELGADSPAEWLAGMRRQTPARRSRTRPAT